jgi:hypothetical protein
MKFLVFFIFTLTVFAFSISSDQVLAGNCSYANKFTCTAFLENTFFVDDAIKKSGDGKTWAQAFKTIQEAVNAVRKENNIKPEPFTIVVASGFYRLPKNNKQKAMIIYEDPKNDLYFLGGFKPGSKCLEDQHRKTAITVLQGNQDFTKALWATFEASLDNLKLVFDGFTVRNFGSLEKSNSGGAFYVSGGILSVKNTNFYENRSKSGGAIWVNTTNAVFSDCVFFDNLASRQGGALNIYNYGPKPSGTINFINCTFGGEGDLANKAPTGGLIFARGSFAIPVEFDGCNMGNNISKNGDVIDNSQFSGSEEEKVD